MTDFIQSLIAGDTAALASVVCGVLSVAIFSLLLSVAGEQ